MRLGVDHLDEPFRGKAAAVCLRHCNDVIPEYQESSLGIQLDTISMAKLSKIEAMDTRAEGCSERVIDKEYRRGNS
jgi:hypothetical protein